MFWNKGKPTLDPVYKLISKSACTLKKKKNYLLLNGRVFMYRHRPFTWSTNYLFSDRLVKTGRGNRSRKLKCFSEATYSRMRCFSLLPTSSVPPTSNLKRGCFSSWLLHHQYFLERDNTAPINQYESFAHFWNSGSCLLRGRCSISDSRAGRKHPYVADA